MKILATSIITILLACIAKGESIDLTILGDQKIQAEIVNGSPKLIQKDGIEILMPSFAVRKGEFAFQFSIRTEDELKSIRIEDVTNNHPILVLEDKAPDCTQNYWSNASPAYELSKENLPWIFEKDDSTIVFRFTIIDAKTGILHEIYQPIVWKKKAKKMIRKMGK